MRLDLLFDRNDHVAAANRTEFKETIVLRFAGLQKLCCIHTLRSMKAELVIDFVVEK